MGCRANALFLFLPEYSFEGWVGGAGAAAQSIAKIGNNGHYCFHHRFHHA